MGGARLFGELSSHFTNERRANAKTIPTMTINNSFICAHYDYGLCVYTYDEWQMSPWPRVADDYTDEIIFGGKLDRRGVKLVFVRGVTGVSAFGLIY